MKSLKPLSLFGLAGLVLATTLSVSCQSTTPVTGTGQTTTQTAAVPDGKSALSGVLYSGVAEDGRFVPPPAPVKIQVMERNNKEVVSVFTDAMGRFYIKDIPASKEGTTYTIKADAYFDQQKTFFSGRVLDLSSIPALASASLQQVRTVTGTLLNPQDQPLANVEVRDKSATFRSVRTDAAGRFSLEVIGQELELLVENSLPISVAVSQFETDPTFTVDTNSVRTITGIIKDSTNSNIFLGNTKVSVQSSGVSTFTDANGKYTLTGAPIGPFILSVDAPDGYADFNVQIPPATFDGNQRPNSIEQNIAIQPVGSIVINFTAESAPYFDRLPPRAATAEGQFCASYLNCFEFYLTIDGRPVAEYNNTLAVREPLQAFVTVEGTNITQAITYPPAPFRVIYGVDEDGQPVRVADRAYDFNVVSSIKLDNVPGGQQNITVSMSGFQTQKSIPIYVPPGDTISTEQIRLFRVEPIGAFGDVKGVIKGIDPNLEGEIRIVYLDVKEDFEYEPILGDRTNPDLLSRIRASISSAYSVVDKNNGNYYLRNVPTGSRVMLAVAMVNSDGELSDCYIPNTSVLLNVSPGQINLAPDLTLVRRPAFSGNCPK
jgi:hypothetical protein